MKHWQEDGGDSVSPHTTPAFCDNDVLPVGGIIAFWGMLMCRGEIPVERSA